MDYVLGFAFNEGNRDWCLFVEKNRPPHLAGKLNGIGGKIDPEDATPVDAMVREFKEECGIITLAQEWTQFARISGEDRSDNGGDTKHSEYTIHCFSAVLPNHVIDTYKTMEDEKIFFLRWEDILNYRSHTPNLSWLVPLANAHNDMFYVVDFERKYEA